MTEVVLIVLILLPNAGCVVLVDSFWVFMPRLSEKASMFNVARYTVIECQFNVWHRKKRYREYTSILRTSLEPGNRWRGTFCDADLSL